jgi:hypothetical protein
MDLIDAMLNSARLPRFVLPLSLLVVGIAGCANPPLVIVKSPPPPESNVPIAIANNGEELELLTSSLRATFKQAALVTLKNVATNENYISTPGSSWVDLPLLKDNGETLQPGTWSLNADGKSASIQFTDSQRTLNLTVGIADQDIFLRLQGTSKAPGVVGSSWGITGLNLTPGRLVIPAYGGTYLDATSSPDVLGLDYPVEWENQMAIYEGESGSVLIYALDSVPYYKRILASRPTGTLNVSFETFAPGPWPHSTAVDSIEWRLRGFSKNWMAAADAYKSYMTSLRPFTPATGARAWIKTIRGVVFFETLDPELLGKLAEEVDPSHTLLVLTTWRKQPYDMGLPDYTPDPNAGAFVQQAHKLGFRVMLHTNLLGISQVNPYYASFKQCQIKTPDTLKPTGWLWDELASGDPRRFAYISPACSAYRQLYISQIKVAIDQLQPDGLHLDAGGAIINDGNGLIEGMNAMQGMIELHKELLAAYPNIVLGGESTNEIIGPYNWLAQRWTYTAPAHPLGNYLEGDQVLFYGFLDQPQPDEQGFSKYLDRYEGFGVVPVDFIVTPYDLDADKQRSHLVLKYQKLLGAGRFLPDWKGDWSGLKFRQLSADGRSVFTITDDGTFLSAAQDGNELYERAHGASTFTTPLFIENWAAYDDTHLFGADSQQQYWLSDSAYRPVDETHLLGVPTNMVIGSDTLRTAQYGMFEIDGSNPDWYNFITEFPGAAKGTIYNSKQYGVIDGATIGVGSAVVKGVFYDSVIFEHPPFEFAIGGADFIEYNVPVPVAPKVTLAFNVAIADDTGKSDGVLFGVQVNDQTLWKQTILQGTGWNSESIDLTPYAGTTVKMRFLTHSGLMLNANFDSACWMGIRINTDFSTTSPLQLQLPKGSAAPKFSSNVNVTSISEDTANITMPVPGKFAVFTTAAPPLAPGESLLDVPITVWKSTGGLPAQGKYDVSGTKGGISSGGVTKTAIAAIPPRNGKTWLTTAATLPPNATTLTVDYGLADPPPGFGSINYSGVTFIVRVNGTELLKEDVNTAGWAEKQIDVSQWKSSPAVFEFVVDADGDQLFDFAYFSGLTVH